MQAIATAAGAIAIGSADVVIAGGVESMTAVPMTGFHLSASPELMHHMPGANTPMGITAENVANRFGITRQMQDEFAYKSQMKAKAALEKGVFKDEIVPVRAVSYADNARVYRDFVVDEMPRGDTTMEGLGKLPTGVRAGRRSVTAGNESSPLSDGAAACIVTKPTVCEHLGLTPLASFRGFAVAGVDPEIMGVGPVPAVRKLLAKHHLRIEDIDIVELNEAFASQSFYCQRELGIRDDQVNVNGGAIALGHPLGCTGAKLTATRALRAASPRRPLRDRHDVHRGWSGCGRAVRERSGRHDDANHAADHLRRGRRRGARRSRAARGLQRSAGSTSRRPRRAQVGGAATPPAPDIVLPHSGWLADQADHREARRSHDAAAALAQADVSVASMPQPSRVQRRARHDGDAAAHERSPGDLGRHPRRSRRAPPTASRPPSCLPGIGPRQVEQRAAVLRAQEHHAGRVASAA